MLPTFSLKRLLLVPGCQGYSRGGPQRCCRDEGKHCGRDGGAGAEPVCAVTGAAGGCCACAAMLLGPRCSCRPVGGITADPRIWTGSWSLLTAEQAGMWCVTRSACWGFLHSMATVQHGSLLQIRTCCGSFAPAGRHGTAARGHSGSGRTVGQRGVCGVRRGLATTARQQQR